MRWHGRTLGLCLGLVSACAFEPGQPWGRAELHLEASFAPAEGRLTADGLLRTSNNYLIRVDSLSVHVGSISLTINQGGAESTFDPASPPDGYSLCHGGHCHSDDGRLVSYEDIAAELGGDDSAVTVSREADADVALAPTPGVVPLGRCADECRLERGDLGRVEVSLSEIRFEARVFDIAPSDGKGLPDEGIPIVGTIPLDARIGAPTSGSVARGEPIGVRVRASLSVAEGLFDGVDWTTELGLVGPVTDPVNAGAFPAVSARIAENAAGSVLAVTVERFDP